ncbi:hypothetical protein M5X06_17560 [Paenibacillus alvei]|uniref:Lipoprotein n=1 Tax=Paenibacillus alvei TaxID=44250 RepID=A0ABT4GZ93_PAEAL|nr:MULTISPECIES: hypothetical protein [Paenibacillus]MCY7486683.1 hypothetical protein [Paenibacillus alvei]MCY9762037.1 hypothetical protein [Paenibacillus alvei]MCY9768613.1 hypothetical protein [Paenibacillus alvei]
MIKRRTIRKASLFLLLASLLLSGCEWVQDPKSMLKEPRLSADKANLKSIIDSQKPEGANVIRPRNADDTSTIRIADLNNDGKGEAIVFYETPDKDVRIHGMIFKSEGDTWTKVFDFDGEGTQLDRVELVDLTGDKNLELVVGYGSNDTKLNKGLVVYRFTDTEMIRMFEQPYSQFVIDDLDQSGKNKLFILNNRTGQSQTAQLSAFDYQNGKLIKYQDLKLSSLANSYTNMVSGFISKDRKGIVLDAIAGANYYLTDIIGMKKDQTLQALLQNGLGNKKEEILSMDMNSDGIIEIGKPETPQGWDQLYQPYEIPYFTNFFQWDGQQGLKLVEKQYRDHLNRFHLTFPKSWYGRVTVDTKSKKDEMLRFVDLHTNETFAIIRFFTPEAWESYKEKWTYLSSFGDKIIGIYSKEPLTANKAIPKIPELIKSDSDS